MLRKFDKIWNNFLINLKYVDESTLKNIIYVVVSFIACLIMFFATKSGVNPTIEFLSDFLSEINYMYAFFSIDPQSNDYVGFIVVPVLYAFLSRVIYYGLDNNSWKDNVLQIIGNCFLQVFLSICIYGAPEYNAEKLVITLSFGLMGFIVIGSLFDFFKSLSRMNPALVIFYMFKYEFKYFFYIFRTPIFKRGFAVILAFFVQAIGLTIIILLLDFLHITLLIFPLSFIITPLFLNKLSDIVMNIFHINKDEEKIIKEDLICFVFAVIILIVLYLPFWSKVTIFD